MNILCATDNHFAPFCGIMLTSLFENNRREAVSDDINVYVLVDNTFSPIQKHKYQKLCSRYGMRLHIIVVDNRILPPLPLNDIHHPITLPTYYRLLAGKLLPTTVHKTIYLDCDIIVAQNLRPLWDISLDGKPLACVRDCLLNFDQPHCARLGYNPNEGYFNAGMLVINLDYWRQNDIETRLADYAQKHYDKLHYMDQDLLNGALHGQVLWLPERYNFQPPFLLNDYWNQYPTDYHNTLVQEYHQAAIIHYIGISKPWHFSYRGSPFHTLWDHYRKISPWRHCRHYKPLRQYLRQTAKRLIHPDRVRRKLEQTWHNIPPLPPAK